MRINRFLAVSLLTASCAAFLPAHSFAQRRAVPRPVAPRPVGPPRVVVGGGVYAPFYYAPWPQYPYGGWYGGYGWGVSGWGSWGWGSYGWGGPGWVGPYGPYGYGQRPLYNGASLRVQVTPADAEVYIDGYYAGTVDQFDGTFQRLRVVPGEHEIAVYAEGFRTLRQSLYVQPLSTVNIRQGLEPLQPGEAQEGRPSPSEAPPTAGARSRLSTRRAAPVQPRTEPQGAAETPPAVREDSNFGVLAVRVQPAGAQVLVDGEQWQGPDTNERLLVQLAPGPHRVEVRRDGFQSFSRTIQIQAGQTESVNVSLTRQ